MVTPLAPQQLAGILPRQAVRMVQDALQAAGCPDADYDARELLRIAAGKDPRLLFDPLTRPQAECLAELAAQRMQRVPLQYLAGEWDFLGCLGRRKSTEESTVEGCCFRLSCNNRLPCLIHSDVKQFQS